MAGRLERRLTAGSGVAAGRTGCCFIMVGWHLRLIYGRDIGAGAAKLNCFAFSRILNSLLSQEQKAKRAAAFAACLGLPLHFAPERLLCTELSSRF